MELTLDTVGYRRTLAVTKKMGDPQKPLLFWLNGYASHQRGEKVTAFREWASQNGYSSLTFDYSGVPLSSGDFAKGTLGHWLEEALAVLELREHHQEVVLIGSSMGAWLALLIKRALAEQKDGPKVLGLLLLAPAVDYTKEVVPYRLTATEKRILQQEGVVELPTPYEMRYLLYQHYLEEAKNHLLFPLKAPFGVPTTLIHGEEDEAIPLSLAERLYREGGDEGTRFLKIRGGDHRLSQPETVQKILEALNELLERISPQESR